MPRPINPTKQKRIDRRRKLEDAAAREGNAVLRALTQAGVSRSTAQAVAALKERLTTQGVPTRLPDEIDPRHGPHLLTPAGPIRAVVALRGTRLIDLSEADIERHEAHGLAGLALVWWHNGSISQDYAPQSWRRLADGPDADPLPLDRLGLPRETPLEEKSA